MRKSLFGWLDDRTNYRRLLAPLTQRMLPRGPSWTYTTAACLLWLLVVEIVTGLLLMMSYSPSINSAWASVNFIEHSPGGAFIRGIHHYASHGILILFAIHLMRVVLVGAFRAPRELIWLTGLLLMPLLVVWAISGNPLAGTQKGMAQIEVEGNIIASTPLIGPTLQRILIGGDQVGNLTLTHLYFLHVGLMPLVVLGLLAVHLSQVHRHGVSISQSATEAGPAQPYWPYQTVRNMIVLAMVLGTIALLAWRVGAPLDAPADPRLAHSPRPEWYFLFLFEVRRYFTGDWEFVATMVIPMAVLAILAGMPFIERRCSSRVGGLLRSMTVVIGGAAWAGLTIAAVARDRGDAEYQAASANMAALSERTRLLADRQGIPPEGAAILLRNDPKTQGPLLFAQHCASCHSHADQQGVGIVAAAPSAPNLFGFGSRAWVSGLLDPNQIAGHQYYGKTRFAKGDMVRTVRRLFSEAGGSEEVAELRGQLQKVAWALSAEASLPSQREADGRDAASITAGAKLLSGDLACTECHRFREEGDLGSAPDLTGYGSREWLLAIISDPAHERFYSGERNDRMPSFAKDPLQPKLNILGPRELGLLVDWLRGDWYEAPSSQ